MLVTWFQVTGYNFFRIFQKKLKYHLVVSEVFDAVCLVKQKKHAGKGEKRSELIQPYSKADY